jgi:hypothetical protein
MAILYSPEMQALVNNDAGGVPMVLPKAGLINGKLRVQVATITLAGQTTADQIHFARIWRDAILLGFRHTTDTSLGSSTVAFGTVHAGESAKFKSAATFTATNTPTMTGLASAIGRDLSADTLYDINDQVRNYVDMVITIGAASLPASGRYIVETWYTVA